MHACGTGGGPALPPVNDVDLAASELIKAELALGDKPMDSLPPVMMSTKGIA